MWILTTLIFQQLYITKVTFGMQTSNKTRTKGIDQSPSQDFEGGEQPRFGNDPFFVKKAAAAKARVDKIGFPKAFLPIDRKNLP